LKKTSSNTQKIPVDSRFEERIKKAKSQRFLCEDSSQEEVLHTHRKRTIDNLIPGREKDWIDNDDYDDDDCDEEFE